MLGTMLCQVYHEQQSSRASIKQCADVSICTYICTCNYSIAHLAQEIFINSRLGKLISHKTKSMRFTISRGSPEVYYALLVLVQVQLT